MQFRFNKLTNQVHFIILDKVNNEMVKVKWNLSILFITMELIAVELMQQASSNDQTIVEQLIVKEIIKIFQNELKQIFYFQEYNDAQNCANKGWMEMIK